MRSISRARSILLCQISSGDSLARMPIRLRYACAVSAAIARARFLESFAASAATATLATNRLRSTVKSIPASVSSKSLMSNTMFSSGVANAPKFIRWQSPQAWTEMPARA